METVKQEILAGRFVTRMVRNQVDHAEQRMFLVLVDGYVHCVPFVEDLDGTFFLKTAFKSRFYQRRYENGEGEPLPADEEERIRADIMSASAKNITIRVQLDDLNGIKKMAKAAGMPYQTLIN